MNMNVVAVMMPAGYDCLASSMISMVGEMVSMPVSHEARRATLAVEMRGDMFAALGPGIYAWLVVEGL